MNDKINPQIFSVLGVNMHIGTTSNHNSAENPAFNYGFFRPKQLMGISYRVMQLKFETHRHTAA
jgi:hypothetical protein